MSAMAVSCSLSVFPAPRSHRCFTSSLSFFVLFFYLLSFTSATQFASEAAQRHINTGTSALAGCFLFWCANLSFVWTIFKLNICLTLMAISISKLIQSQRWTLKGSPYSPSWRTHVHSFFSTVTLSLTINVSKFMVPLPRTTGIHKSTLLHCD